MNQRAWDPGRSGRSRGFVLAPSRETLVLRAVRDHQHMAATHWIVTTPVPEHETAMHDALHTGYRAWLRTTAAAGIASALLVAPTATSAASATHDDPAGTGQDGGDATDASALLLQAAQGQHPAESADLPPLAAGVPEDQPPPAGLTRMASQPPPPLEVAPLVPPVALHQSPAIAQPPRPVEQPEPAGTRALQAQASPEPVVTTVQEPIPQKPISQELTPQELTPQELTPQEPIPQEPTPQETLTPQRLERWVMLVGSVTGPTAPAVVEAPDATPAMMARSEVTAVPTLGWSYAVQPGDTLWEISEQLWTDGPSDADVDRTWRVLYEWNSPTLGPDPDKLQPGQVLEIPATFESSGTTQ